MRFYPGVSMITLGVRDVERASAFYERLGWKRSRGASSPAITFFGLNNIVLALFPRDALAQDSGFDSGFGNGPGSFADEEDRPGFSGVSLAQNYGSRESVNTAMQDAEQAGGRILLTPSIAAWGGYHGVFADPDGHVWELAFNPFMPVGPDGSLTLPD